MEGVPPSTMARLVATYGSDALEVVQAADGPDALTPLAPGVPLSPSLGHVATTCSHPDTTSHRYDSPAEKRRQGITDGLVRLSVGVEELGQIRRELARGLG